MQNLVIVIGNARIKSTLFEKADLTWEGVFDEVGEGLESCFEAYRRFCNQIGIWYGKEYEMTGPIQAFQKDYSEINVFVCEGDAQSFVSLAKGHIFVVPNLVLHGLDCILNHNVE